MSKEFNFMDKKEVIELIKEVGYEQNGSINSDGEYVEYCKGDEEYLFDNEDINELAEKLIKLFDVTALFKPNELWRMAQKYNCDDFTQMIEQSKSLNKSLNEGRT